MKVHNRVPWSSALHPRGEPEMASLLILNGPDQGMPAPLEAEEIVLGRAADCHRRAGSADDGAFPFASGAPGPS